MTEKEETIHLECRMHEAHDRALNELKTAKGKLWDELNKRPTKGAILTLTGILLAAFVTLFGVFYESIHSQNIQILKKVDEQKELVDEKMESFNDKMTNIQIELRELQVLFRRMNGDIEHKPGR